jgi:aryl-alcohol dehydrogenase-like predicted oxidoreductase
MEYINLGKSDLKISRLGFGCCPMGQHGWGHTHEKELIDAVNLAIDYGIKLFDTADIYGLGKSESILGKALGKRRHKVIIASKFGVRIEKGKTFYDNSSEWIKKTLEESLIRLKTDYIDLYQLHYWDKKTPIFEILNTLRKLKDQGKIRFFGFTNFDLVGQGIEERVDGLSSFSFEYSLAMRKFEPEIFKNYEKLKIPFFSWGSLGQGLLSGKYDNKTKFLQSDRRRKKIYGKFYGKKLESNLRIIQYMLSVIDNYKDKTLSQMAIRWILDQIPNSIALVGIKRPDQLVDNLGALDWKLDKKHHEELSKLSNPI